MTPSEFLTTLWGTEPPGKVLIWTAPQKKSYWYTNYKTLDSDVEKLAKNANIYTGIGLAASNAKVSPRKRVVADNIAAIAGLWADIDVAHEVHKKTQLAPSIEAATEALDTLYYTPTLIVNSGHGLQAWWLFDQPWVFRDNEERATAQTLSRWWYQEILQLMQKEGWTPDPTHDLARVLRLPGTFNRKADPVPVTVMSSDGPRFDRTEFLDRLPQSPCPPNPPHPANTPRPQAAQTTQAQQAAQPSAHLDNTAQAPVERAPKGSITLSPTATPPLYKLMALLENDPKFRASWEGKRRDFTKGSSPSEYDFSLASMALHAEWQDQEVVDLLIAWRTKHGHDLKLREDYYLTTIAKAKRPIEQSQAQTQLEEAILTPGHGPKGPELIETLTAIFNIGIRQIIKYAGDPPTYSMFTEKGHITLGQIASITSQITFRNAVAAATGILIPKCKDKIWDQRAQAILQACETIDMGDSSHPVQETNTWLYDYMADRPLCDTIEEALPTKQPFKRNGKIYIFLDNFRKWTEFTTNNRFTSHDMGRRLSDSGATAEAVPCLVNNRKTTRSCWRLAEQT